MSRYAPGLVSSTAASISDQGTHFKTCAEHWWKRVPQLHDDFTENTDVWYQTSHIGKPTPTPVSDLPIHAPMGHLRDAPWIPTSLWCPCWLVSASLPPKTLFWPPRVIKFALRRPRTKTCPVRGCNTPSDRMICWLASLGWRTLKKLPPLERESGSLHRRGSPPIQSSLGTWTDENMS